MQPPQTSDIVDVVGLTPVPSSPPPASEEGRIRCVCGSEEDDGFTIQCDGCLVWQHAGCVGIARHTVPETYLCDECRPEVDVEAPPRARRGRPSLSSRDSLSLSSSSSLFPPPPASPMTAAAAASAIPGTNDIGENIVGVGEATEGVAELLSGLEEARRRMPRLPRDVPLGQVSFELCPTTVVFPTREALESSGKMLEVRELRARSLVGRKHSAQVARMGVFAAEEIDPGAYIGEYFGQVQPTSVLHKMSRVETVTQSHVLFCAATPRLIVDARKFGGMLRYVRRSCRANCQVKLLLIEDETEGAAGRVHWCLFSRNTIRAGEELLLPFDYAEGNRYFSYECCCSYPELCLADDMANPIGGGKEGAGGSAAAATTGPRKSLSGGKGARPGDSPLGGGRSSSPITAGSSSSTAPAPLVSARKEAMGERKLSREERKLQQYIEFIERMESAERKHHSRKAGSSSHSGGANSPPPAGHHGPAEQPPASMSSPTKRSRKSTTPISARKSSVVATSGIHRSLSSSQQQLSPLPPPSSSTATISEGEAITSPESARGRLRGPSSSSEASAATSPSKLSMPLKKFLSKSLTGGRSSEPASPGKATDDYHPVKSDPHVMAIKPDPYTGGNASSMEEVDVVGLTSPPPMATAAVKEEEAAAAAEGSAASLPSSAPSGKGEEESGSSATASAPETPSKKRVSLSDYLSRRRSSPAGEGGPPSGGPAAAVLPSPLLASETPTVAAMAAEEGCHLIEQPRPKRTFASPDLSGYEQPRERESFSSPPPPLSVPMDMSDFGPRGRPLGHHHHPYATHTVYRHHVRDEDGGRETRPDQSYHRPPPLHDSHHRDYPPHVRWPVGHSPPPQLPSARPSSGMSDSSTAHRRPADWEQSRRHSEYVSSSSHRPSWDRERGGDRDRERGWDRDRDRQSSRHGREPYHHQQQHHHHHHRSSGGSGNGYHHSSNNTRRSSRSPPNR